MAAPSAARRGAGTRTGSTSGAAVEVVGMKEFRRELKKLDDPKAWSKELSRANKEIAKKSVGWARAVAMGMGGPQAHFAGALRARGGLAGARIAVADGNANAAFWGAKQRTGWNAGNETPNLPRWVGNSWSVGVSGQGPYAINDAIAANKARIIDAYADAIDDIARRAFPSTSTG